MHYDDTASEVELARAPGIHDKEIKVNWKLEIYVV